MINNKRGEIVTLLALGTTLVVAVAAIISSTFMNTKPQTTVSNAQSCVYDDCSSWKCPGPNCDKCGIAPYYWWATGCPALPAQNGCCTPCGDVAKIYRSGDPETKCIDNTGYRSGNDGCYHADTTISCGGEPDPTETPPPGENPVCESAKDKWYCAGECADANERSLFNATYPDDGSDEWRAERAGNCKIDVDDCDTAECGGSYTCEANGKTYQVGTNYCDGTKIMDCVSPNNAKLVSDCGTAGCDPSGPKCKGTGGGGGGGGTGGSCKSPNTCLPACPASRKVSGSTCSATGTTCCKPVSGGGGGGNVCPADQCKSNCGKDEEPDTSKTCTGTNSCCVSKQDNTNTCTTCTLMKGTIEVSGDDDIRVGPNYPVEVYAKKASTNSLGNYSYGPEVLIGEFKESEWSWDGAESKTRYSFRAILKTKNGILVEKSDPDILAIAGSPEGRNIVLQIHLDGKDRGQNTTNLIKYTVSGTIINDIEDLTKRGPFTDLEAYIANSQGNQEAVGALNQNGFFKATIEVPEDEVPDAKVIDCIVKIRNIKTKEIVDDGDKGAIGCNPEPPTNKLIPALSHIRYEKQADEEVKTGEDSKTIHLIYTYDLRGTECATYQPKNSVNAILVSNKSLQVLPNTFSLSKVEDGVWKLDQNIVISKIGQQLDNDGKTDLVVNAYFKPDISSVDVNFIPAVKELYYNFLDEQNELPALIDLTGSDCRVPKSIPTIKAYDIFSSIFPSTDELPDFPINLGDTVRFVNKTSPIFGVGVRIPDDDNVLYRLCDWGSSCSVNYLLGYTENGEENDKKEYKFEICDLNLFGCDPEPNRRSGKIIINKSQ